LLKQKHAAIGGFGAWRTGVEDPTVWSIMRGSSTATHPGGDFNGGGQVSTADVFYLMNHFFANGPAPVASGCVNGDGQVTIADVFYLANFLFANGPAPR